MTTWNDITGDPLISRVLSKKGEEAFEEIFGKRKTNGGWTPPPIEVASVKTTTNKPVELWTEADEKRLEIIGHNGNTGYGHSDFEEVPQAIESNTEATKD